MTSFINGDVVRLVGNSWTKNLRRELWVVEDPRLIREDWGAKKIGVRRQSDRALVLDVHRKFLAHTTLLDLLVHNLDESEQ